MSHTIMNLEKDTTALAIKMNGKVLVTANCQKALDVAWEDRYTFVGMVRSRQFTRHERQLAKTLNNPTKHSFAQGFSEALQGDTRPIAELWDGIDV